MNESTPPTTSKKSPYQLVFTQGVDADQVRHLGYKVVAFNLTAPDTEAALSVIEDPDLKIADTKTMALFVAAGSVPAALVAYTATIGFSGRFLDVAAFPVLEKLSALVATGRRIAREAEAALVGTQPHRLPHVMVAPAPVEGIPTIVYDPTDPLASIDLNAAKKLRFARRVELVAPNDMVQAFRLFAALAGLRSTVKTPDRLPSLTLQGTPGEESEHVVDLEASRAAARQLRNKMNIPDLSQLVAPPAPDDLRARVAAARALPMAPVLEALGSRKAPSGDYWHCPRPQRHANGDRNPSMKISDNKVRCFVCDAEWVDPVALAMSVGRMSPTEAATLVATANAS